MSALKKRRTAKASTESCDAGKALGENLMDLQEAGCGEEAAQTLTQLAAALQARGERVNDINSLAKFFSQNGGHPEIWEAWDVIVKYCGKLGGGALDSVANLMGREVCNITVVQKSGQKKRIEKVQTSDRISWLQNQVAALICVPSDDFVLIHKGKPLQIEEGARARVGSVGISSGNILEVVCFPPGKQLNAKLFKAGTGECLALDNVAGARLMHRGQKKLVTEWKLPKGSSLAKAFPKAKAELSISDIGLMKFEPISLQETKVSIIHHGSPDFMFGMEENRSGLGDTMWLTDEVTMDLPAGAQDVLNKGKKTIQAILRLEQVHQWVVLHPIQEVEESLGEVLKIIEMRPSLTQ